MRTIIFAILGLLFLNESIGQVSVNGYYRKDGTYVQPHYRSNPDGNPYNNWSYPKNVNPYTGKVATGNPSTYLANYYKTYTGTYSNEKYDNYTSVLCYTNYEGLSMGDSYTLSNNYGKKTGYVNYYKDRVFRIYDYDFNHIGYVETNKTGRRYIVYDLYGYKVTSNRSSTGVTILAVVGAIGFGVLVGLSASY